ncbi:PREDICTED: probable LRR receptor-like serine/threonine-protein kinase At1g05700 isoform X2 [Camelina sativa]|uniref:Probable LRR receptor-like serine/threonine-protein kinase At1g05700 isoform X2 n=1 Tax=Camelina sativa TaxID=90675 RepID=A0ABM0TNJ6_CAMSA|nr:PREDICTED: probable LRR receptor-like serine/threonine-protein kinase At1g05700 isoform X2 [Camelina sativa]
MSVSTCPVYSHRASFHREVILLNSGIMLCSQMHIDKSISNGSVVVSKEVVYLSQAEKIFVCLGNKGKGTPFISTLELRFLGNDNTTYESPNGALFFSRRWDFATLMDSPVRYDDDVYDRIWIPRNFGYCRERSIPHFQ